ncbi:MAG: pyrroline-5-carboxylate reductase [Fervidicoccaceae archaeon]
MGRVVSVICDMGERIAIIGAGKMGRILIKTLVSSGYSVVATGRSEATIREAEALGAIATRDNDQAVRSADLVILAVKPFHLSNVVKEVKPESWDGKVVLSILAGVKIATIKRFTRGSEVYRAMPNVCALVGKSSTAVSHDGGGKGPGAEVVERVLSQLGRVYWVPEELLDAWTGLVGSGPAYIAEIIDGLVLGGLAVGMPRELALASILDVLEGTAEYLRRLGVHPAQMRDAVITPRGTTIAGIAVLERGRVKSTLIKTVQSATKKSEALSKMVNSMVEEGGAN